MLRPDVVVLRPCPQWTAPVAAAATLLACGSASAQQVVGHKVGGTLGLGAGSQPDPGVYIVDQIRRLRGRETHRTSRQHDPPGPASRRLQREPRYRRHLRSAEPRDVLSASVGVPMARVSLNTHRPEASIDSFGLGDLYVQPLRLGWRDPRLDVVLGYGFYVPTAPHEPGGTDGVGSAQWTHEASLGGTITFDRDRVWALSALASYEVNGRKLDVDVTRGQNLQIQSGLGAKVRPYLDVGVAAYGFWQVTLDRGADLPRVLRGLRDTAFGAGPEVDIAVAPIRGHLSVRYEHDLSVRARPLGQVFVIQLVVAAWAPGRVLDRLPRPELGGRAARLSPCPTSGSDCEYPAAGADARRSPHRPGRSGGASVWRRRHLARAAPRAPPGRRHAPCARRPLPSPAYVSRPTPCRTSRLSSSPAPRCTDGDPSAVVPLCMTTFTAAPSWLRPGRPGRDRPMKPRLHPHASAFRRLTSPNRSGGVRRPRVE